MRLVGVNPAYVDVAVERWQRFTGNSAVLDGSGETFADLAATRRGSFAAKLNAVLWTAKTVAEGGTGDLFHTTNKETAGDDLGLTLQTGFVTKALLGLRLGQVGAGLAAFDRK